MRLITSGRDLLLLKNDSAKISDGDPVVIANPDFDYGATMTIALINLRKKNGWHYRGRKKRVEQSPRY